LQVWALWFLLHPTSAWRPAFTPPAGQAGCANRAWERRSRGKPLALLGGGVFGVVRFAGVVRLPVLAFRVRAVSALPGFGGG